MHRMGMCITYAQMEAEMKNRRKLFPALVVSKVSNPLIPLLPTGHGARVHCRPPRDRNLQLSPKL